MLKLKSLDLAFLRRKVTKFLLTLQWGLRLRFIPVF